MSGVSEDQPIFRSRAEAATQSTICISIQSFDSDGLPSVETESGISRIIASSLIMMFIALPVSISLKTSLTAGFARSEVGILLK
jgi:hypothetical protein